MSCSADPAENLAKAEWRIREAAGGARRSSACRSCFARSISAARRTPNCSIWPSRFPGHPPRRSGKLARELKVVIIASLFERRAAGRVSQHGGDPRRRRRNRGPLPQDAHPRRSAVFREILLHAGRSGIPQFRHALRAHRRAGVLGPVVSGGRAHHGAGRRGHPVLSDGHRLASQPRKRSTARRSSTPGAPSSAPTPSPTACTSRR